MPQPAALPAPDRHARLPRPFAVLSRRWQRWWQARLLRTDTVTLTQRNVYILPTGAGWMLAITLLVLLIASINFQLNLGYLLTFLLAGSAVVGMHLCHATLRGLTLHLLPPEPQFLGSSTAFEIQLTSARASTRYGVGVAVHGSGQWVWTDVPAEGSATVHVAFRPERRGLHPVPTLTAETRFPLGTFRVWTLWRPAAEVLVYPQPEMPAPPLPAFSGVKGSPPPASCSAPIALRTRPSYRSTVRPPCASMRTGISRPLGRARACARCCCATFRPFWSRPRRAWRPMPPSG